MRNCYFVYRKEARAKFCGIERHRALLPNDYAKEIRLQRRLRVPIVQIISLPFNDLTNLDGWRFKRGKPGSVHWREGVSRASAGGYPFDQRGIGVGDCFSAADCGRAADPVWALAVTVTWAYTASAGRERRDGSAILLERHLTVVFPKEIEESLVVALVHVEQARHDLVVPAHFLQPFAHDIPDI